ncbi:MAG: hypothetical protein IPK35_03065 [Saprospiraceae bacterium]|nr:hypothetical protein [Saprospiraceae bacterium]
MKEVKNKNWIWILLSMVLEYSTFRLHWVLVCKASDYINNFNSKYALVSTNSICQGEQVSLLWPSVFSKNQEIFLLSNHLNGRIMQKEMLELHVYSWNSKLKHRRKTHLQRQSKENG